MTVRKDSVPDAGSMSAQWLRGRFGGVGSPGWSQIVEGEDGSTFSRTGSPATLCWGSADEVVAELGEDRAERTGYFCSETSTSLMAGLTDGHDLAIVDGRYLVDGWLAHVEEAGPCVLDLEDPADIAMALSIHEPFERWTVVPGTMARAEKT